MAVKKFELYSSIWVSWDALRVGMDACEYKDNVLKMLVIDCNSLKQAGVPDAAITVPAGGRFNDDVALEGKSTFGDIHWKFLSSMPTAFHSGFNATK